LAKFQLLSANGGDGCRNPLGASWCRNPLGASSWSPDINRYHSNLFVVLVFLCFIFFLFDLLCKRFSSPPYIGSAVVALFIKRGENLFRGGKKVSKRRLHDGREVVVVHCAISVLFWSSHC
jgi:hypothetical protein